MPHIHPDTPFNVYAPGATLWWHPRLAPWAVWLRTHGWRGWLPPSAMRSCYAFYPDDHTCQCGIYHVQWKEMDDGSTDKD